MSEHIPMKITLDLEFNEIIIANNPFDGVLARVFFDKQKEKGLFNGDYTQKLDFLTMSDGVYHASNPIYKINFLSNEFLTKSFDNKLFNMIGKNPTAPTLYNKKSGRYKSWLESYEKHNVEKVIYFIKGDYEIISKLVANLRFLGKKASIGYGKIDKIIIEEIETDYSLVKDNCAMRHLPAIDKYKSLSDKKKGYFNLTHPYWKKGCESVCIMPERRDYV